MSIHINEVLDYLDAHPIRAYQGGVDSLMEMLHEVYTMHNSIDSEEIRNMFHKLRNLLKMLPPDGVDQVFSLVCDLCIAHEILAFSHGVVVGMHLMTEVNMLP